LACLLNIDADLDPAYQFDADPDPVYHPDADPEARIRMLPFNLMRIRIPNTAVNKLKS
jgi:hypothetical protein